MFQFEVRCPINVDVSDEFKRHVKWMFVTGGNAMFHLVDVLESVSDCDGNGSLWSEVERLIHTHGSRLVLNRSEWVS